MGMLVQETQRGMARVSGDGVRSPPPHKDSLITTFWAGTADVQIALAPRETKCLYSQGLGWVCLRGLWLVYAPSAGAAEILLLQTLVG